MNDLFAQLLVMSVAGSVILCVMLLFRPVTAGLFSAKWQYIMGKVALLFFLLPVPLMLEKLSARLLPSRILLHHDHPVVAEAFTPLEVSFVPLKPAGPAWPLILDVCSYIWISGVVILGSWYVYCYCRFLRELRTSSVPIPADSAMYALLHQCKMKLGIRSHVQLLHNHNITSPKLVGLLRPTLLLPADDMRGVDWELVLTHELKHLQRKDLWVKIVALSAGILHWFNPLVHLLRKEIHTWGELSCDEALAVNMTLAERRRYGETILHLLEVNRNEADSFCTPLSGSGKLIKRRLRMLIQAKKPKKYVTIFSVIALLVIGGAGVAASVLVGDFTSTAQAAKEQEIAADTAFLGYTIIETNRLSEADTIISIGSDQIKIVNEVELKGDGKEYTFAEFKQWLEQARMEADELVKSGEWSEEKAAKRLASYETRIMEIEKFGGMAFGQMLNDEDVNFPEKVENFYTIDQLVFELPATIADTEEEVGFTLAIRPKNGS